MAVQERQTDGGDIGQGVTTTSSTTAVIKTIQTSSASGLEEATTTTITSSATATASTSASASASTANKSDNTPYSSGDLAGGIVGAALGAALLTFLATFLFFRKRRGRRQSSYGLRNTYDSGALAISDEKPSAKRDLSNAPWQAYFRQSADDRAIQNDVKALFDSLDLHVENFYRKASLKPDATLATALARLDSGQLPGPIEELIQRPKLARPVIKHILSSVLAASMSPAAGAEHSLLPANLTMVPTKLQSSKLRSQEAPAARQAYSEWKRLNAYLCPPSTEDPEFIKEKTKVCMEISDNLDAALSPWRAQADENILRQHERSLIIAASSVAIKLMSQSWDYQFVWNETGAPADQAIITTPGLSKITDDKGTLLQTPQLLVAPSFVRI